MKMHLTRGDQGNLIRSCSDAGISVGTELYQSSLVVSAEHVSAWSVDSIDALCASSFAELLVHKPEIVLIGTGKAQHFASPETYASLLNAGVGVEFMTTPAACRTFNILLAESRNVLAALIPL